VPDFSGAACRCAHGPAGAVACAAVCAGITAVTAGASRCAPTEHPIALVPVRRAAVRRQYAGQYIAAGLCAWPGDAGDAGNSAVETGRACPAADSMGGGARRIVESGVQLALSAGTGGISEPHGRRRQRDLQRRPDNSPYPFILSPAVHTPALYASDTGHRPV